jgi:hypothetical protein
MTKGSWKECLDDPIQISVNGNLLNGQTRLNAVIASGKSVKFVFHTIKETDGLGELTAVGLPIDRGATRTISDLTGEKGRYITIASCMVRDLAPNGPMLVRDVEVVHNVYKDLKDSIDYVVDKCSGSERYFSQASIKIIMVLRHYQGYDYTDNYKNVISMHYNKLPNAWNSWMKKIIETQSHDQHARKKIMALTWSLTDPGRDQNKAMAIKDVNLYFDEVMKFFYVACGSSLSGIKLK